MTLKTIQKLQLVWVVLGLGFNAASYWQINAGHAALSSTDAISGGIFMAICGIVIFAGLKGATKVYKFIIPVLTLSLGYSGWFLHINAYLHDSTLPGYASFFSWLVVILINSYGLVTLLFGSWLAWQKR